MARERVNNIDFDEIKKIASKKGLTFRTLSEKSGLNKLISHTDGKWVGYGAIR